MPKFSVKRPFLILVGVIIRKVTLRTSFLLLHACIPQNAVSSVLPAFLMEKGDSSKESPYLTYTSSFTVQPV